MEDLNIPECHPRIDSIIFAQIPISPTGTWSGKASCNLKDMKIAAATGKVIDDVCVHAHELSISKENKRFFYEHHSDVFDFIEHYVSGVAEINSNLQSAAIILGVPACVLSPDSITKGADSGAVGGTKPVAKAADIMKQLKLNLSKIFLNSA